MAKSSLSPTQRTLKMMRDRGYLCQIVEVWNPFARIRVDLFGFGDVLCIKAGEIVLVQTTSGSNVSKRAQKIADHANTPIVRAAGMTISIHGWRKLKAGWACRELDVS